VDKILDRILNSGREQLLIKAMDAASLRNDVIANNIANVDTPDFKKSEVSFSDKIRDVLLNQSIHIKLELTDKRHLTGSNSPGIQTIRPEILSCDSSTYRNDGNNVDIDVEMAELTKNKIFYDAMGQSISNEIKLLRLAIERG
jgi:flagellar basal-body rod protein FlgB